MPWFVGTLLSSDMTRIAAAGESTRMSPNLFQRRTEKAKTNPFSHFPFVSLFPLLLLSLSRFRLLLSPVHVSLTSLSRMQKNTFVLHVIFLQWEIRGKANIRFRSYFEKKKKSKFYWFPGWKNFCIRSIVPSLPFPHHGIVPLMQKSNIFVIQHKKGFYSRNERTSVGVSMTKKIFLNEFPFLKLHPVLYSEIFSSPIKMSFT